MTLHKEIQAGEKAILAPWVTRGMVAATFEVGR